MRAGRGLVHLAVFALVPLAGLLVANLFNPQPISDNVLMLKIFYLLAAVAGLPALFADRWLRRGNPFVILGLIAGIGPAALLFWWDWIDDYFTKPGVGIIVPLTGYIIGGAYGLILAWHLRTH